MIVVGLLPCPACGRFIVLFLFAWIVGLCLFGGLVLFGLLPVPIFIGEVLSDFSLPGCGFGPRPLYSLVGLCPFGNKFLFIQKKKKVLRQEFSSELGKMSFHGNRRNFLGTQNFDSWAGS